MEKIYDPKKLTEELQAAGLPVTGVSSTGRVDYNRELTKKEQITSISIFAAHDPGLTESEIKLGLFSNAGVSLQEMVMALWYKVAKNDGSAVSALAERIDSARSG